MSDEIESKLEQQIERELRALPDVPAPRTLIPRVRAALAAGDQRAWWRRPWLTWPVPVRVFSSIVLALSAGAVWYGCNVLWDACQGASYVAHASRWFGLFALIANSLVTLGRALVVAGQSAGQQFLLYGAAVCLAMYAACVGFGTIFYRMVCPSRPRS